jgi:hypothetical protein
MITGTKAAARWHSEGGVEKAKKGEDAKVGLFVTEGLMHTDLSHHVDVAWWSFSRGIWLERPRQRPIQDSIGEAEVRTPKSSFRVSLIPAFHCAFNT